MSLKARAARTARNKDRKPLPLQEIMERRQKMQQELEQQELEGMEQHMARLQKEADKAQRELDRVRRLRVEFPDLRIRTDRWDRVRYQAKSANPRADQVEFRKTCGCCADAGYLAMPYLETALGRVYSHPHSWEVGEFEYDGNLRPHADWESKYESAGVSPALILKIQKHVQGMAQSEEDEEE